MNIFRTTHHNPPPELASAHPNEGGYSSILITFSLFYLWVCNALFFTGWYQPWLSLPLSGATFIYIIYYAVKLYRGNDNWIPAKNDWLRFTLCAAVIIGYLIVSGQIGGFPSPSDFAIFRQALYENLAHAPWPLILPNGKEMTYYIAGMLPACMMERMMPPTLSQIPVLIHTFLPVFLAILLFARRWKYLPLLLVLMAISLQDPLCMFFRPTALMEQKPSLMSEWIRYIHDHSGLDLEVLCSYYGNKTIVAPLRTCVHQYNSQTYTILATALLLNTPSKVRALYPLIVSLLFSISPLGALALLPIASYLFLRAHPLPLNIIHSCILPLLTVLACIPYFVRAAEGPTIITSGIGLYGTDSHIALVRYIAGLAVLFLPLWRCEKHKGLYWAAVFTAFFIFALYVGSPRYSGFPGVNELTMKGSAVITAVLAFLYIENWKKLAAWFRIGLTSWLIFATSFSLIGQIKNFSPEKKVDDYWNGHLNHQHPFLNQSIPGTKPSSTNFFMLRKSGESEYFFPGSILPKAPGCDYSKPIGKWIYLSEKQTP